jgi:hypothetical protein
MNKNLLRSIMVLWNDTNAKLADYLGITQSRLSAKMNEWEGAQFTQSEIRMIRDRYNLTSDQLMEIFF